MPLFALALLSFVCLLLGMLLFTEIGRRIGLRRLALHSRLSEGVGAAKGAVFGLLGLLLAFGFSGAADRFQERRHLITDEANAIGTAYLRVDLMPAEAQPEMRGLFRDYVDSRLRTYAAASDRAAVDAGLAETSELQLRIWAKAVEAGQRPGATTPPTMLLLPALNEMIDITTTRLMATRNHPPAVLFAMLGIFALVGALLVGYSGAVNKDRSWLHTLAFATVLSMTIYVIVDLEFPRLGLIRVDGSDRVLVELRRSMD